MKYAFILGSNAFITSHGIISYTDNGETKEFLRINDTIKNKSGVAGKALSVNIDIKDLNGNAVKLSNDGAAATNVHLVANDRIKITNPDGTTVIEVHELGKDAVRGLSHHITSELDTEGTVAVIRLFGHFVVGNNHISIDNEKLFIDGNSYAESVHVEHHNGGIVFTETGVLL
jgi:hypothetical protein